MNYLQPRQLEHSKKWHFTCKNDGKIWPVGYCRDHEGHDTEQEAIDCYGKYILDHLKQWDATSAEKCVECGAWTNHIVEGLHGSLQHICKDHPIKEVFADHFTPPSMIWSS